VSGSREAFERRTNVGNMRLLHERTCERAARNCKFPSHTTVTPRWTTQSAVSHLLTPFSNPGSYTAKCYRYQIGDAKFQVDVLYLHPNQLSEAGAIICMCNSPHSRHGAKFRLQSSEGLVTIETKRFWLLRRRLLATVQYHGRRYPCEVPTFS
jgi:hypothetical protein